MMSHFGFRISDCGIKELVLKPIIILLATIFLLIFDPQIISAEKPAFKPALPGWKYVFPRDYWAHRDFKTEWWYYNGYLNGPEGRHFGYQMTFFRVGFIPGPRPKEGSLWQIRDVYIAHLAVTDIERKTFHFQEKASRGNLGLAGAEKDRYRVWVETWQVSDKGKGHAIQAGDENLSLSLQVIPTRPPLIHGIDGVSQKGHGTGRASHYYSLTRMETQGIIKIKGKEIPVQGTSWMDHEFGSNQLQETQIGWDWFSIQLDNGLDLMLYQLRHEDGRVDLHSSGTLAGPDFLKAHLSFSDFKIRISNYWKSPRSGAVYPSFWEIDLPQQALRLTLVPMTADQELMTPQSARITYWEGIVKVRGTYQERTVEGKGYVEMTGYDQRFRPKF
jgi:predicted secreted hydrolase